MGTLRAGRGCFRAARVPVIVPPGMDTHMALKSFLSGMRGPRLPSSTVSSGAQLS